MIGFLIGLFIGGFVGMIIMGMMHIASNEDEQMREGSSNKE